MNTLVESIDESLFFTDKIALAARLARVTESPIEILFGMAMLELLRDDWELTPQFNWGKYRIDWVLELPSGKMIFVECDGREFHTRPDQVLRDRRRDARIRSRGIQLFRFTGSEIFHNAKGCAQRVYEAAIKT